MMLVMLFMVLTHQLTVAFFERITHVSPNGKQCTQSPCLAFKQLLEDSKYHFVSGNTLLLLPGNYTVNSTSYVTVKGISNFRLLGMASNTSSTPAVIFQCHGKLSFTFVNIMNLHISDIQFIRCGLPIQPNIIEKVQSILNGTQAALLLNNVTSMHARRLHIRESSGFGLLAINVIGQSEISSTVFSYNNYYAQVILEEYGSSIEETCQMKHGSFTPCIGGSVHFFFQNDMIQDAIVRPVNRTIYALNIVDLEVISGVSGYIHEGYQQNYFSGSSGLSLIFEQTSYQMRVTVNRTKFQSNQGAGVLVQINKSATDVFILNCIFNNTKWYGLRNGYTIGYVISYKRDYPHCNDPSEQAKLVVSDCQFINNAYEEPLGDSPSLLAIEVLSGYQQSQVLITNCEFKSNRGSALALVAGGGGSTMTQAGSLWIEHSTIFNNTAAAVKVVLERSVWKVIGIKNVTIANNGGRSFAKRSTMVEIQGGNIPDTSVVIAQTSLLHNKPSCTVNLLNVNNITFIDCTFQENDGSAVCAQGSKIYFIGKIVFLGNQGQQGGALALFLASGGIPDHIFTVIHLFPDTHLHMINNSAQKGGAIYREQPLSELEVPLKMLPCPPRLITLEGPNTSIVLNGNKASVAGDSIYGLIRMACVVPVFDPQPPDPLYDVFSLINPPSSSEVAATPRIVCICDPNGHPDCTHWPITVLVYPGKVFSIPAIATGDEILSGAVPASIKVQIPADYKAHLGVRQESQALGRACTNVTFSVSTSEQNIELLLSVESQFGAQVQRSIKLKLISCPIGFTLQGEQPRCGCAPRLDEHNCTCNIEEFTFQCPLHTWIGNHSDDIIVHKHCSLDYCIPKAHTILLKTLDDQCQFNRSGILCGGCQPGLSLALGTSKCLQCSDLYLLLLPVFILAGLGLVAVLLLCNLTVSTGTINGLIYFANMIQVNHATFFPENKTGILAVFIAWLNLDFGIQTCFYNGMDMYAKAWLQFVFPVYIWVLVGFIITASRYSIFLSRLTGSHSVQVLATLFLLSYAKLLRAIITVFSSTHLTYAADNTSLTWLYDGNVPFMKGKHAALFVMALIATLGFMIPYTVLLLLSPYLQARSNRRALRWVNRLKPFLDAYHGPYKDKFRNWTGVMLIARVAQFVIFAFNVQGDPNVNLLVIVIFSALLLTVLFNLGRPYKNKLKNLLESCLILKLGVYAATVLHFRTLGSSSLTQSNTATNIIVSITFFIFWLIVAYHAYPIIGKRLWIKFRCQKCIRQQPVQDVIEDMENSAYNVQSQPPTVSYIELREVLLEAAK